MLKKLLNNSERITYGRLCEVCVRHAAAVYAKVRLADVLPIEGSGVSVALYDFALVAHYDFVVTGRDQVPLFALEFDGPQHSQSPQVERDAKKDELSSRFDLPLMRVHGDDLLRSESQLDKLTEVVEQWFKEHTDLATGTVRMQATPKCPLCGGEMARKQGKYGTFLSCVRYPACMGSCDLPGRPKSFNIRRWKKVLVAFSIFAAVVAAVVLLLKFGLATPQRSGQQVPNVESKPTIPGKRSAMSLQERQAYANALKESDYPMCPLCGKKMVLRNNATTGNPFFGCSEFPRCRGTRDVQYPK